MAYVEPSTRPARRLRRRRRAGCLARALYLGVAAPLACAVAMATLIVVGQAAVGEPLILVDLAPLEGLAAQYGMILRPSPTATRVPPAEVTLPPTSTPLQPLPPDTATVTPSPTSIMTTTPTETETGTPTATESPSPSPSSTDTASPSPTSTRTRTPAITWTRTPTRTATRTPSRTATMAMTARASTTSTPVPPTVTPGPPTDTPGPGTVYPSDTPSFTPPPPTSTPVPPTATPTMVCNLSGNDAFESTLLVLINTERQNQGLRAYGLQGQLQAAARVHSADMACNSFVSHTGSDGSSVRDRVARQGYSWSWIGENIYSTSDTSSAAPQRVFDWWMNSAPHRANLMSPNYTEIGLGYRYNSATGRGYFTAVFARP